MKCAVLQSCDTNYDEVISTTSPVNRKYAEYHGAEYILHKHDQDHNRHPSWNKIYSTLDLIWSNRYDYIFFLDGDAVVTDITRNIFDLAKDSPDILLHLCDDLRQKRELDSNWGVFLIKSDRLMIQFLEKILHDPAINQEEQQYIRDFYHKGRDWEQSVIQCEFATDVSYYKKIVKIYHGQTFNHYKGNWVYHPCYPDISDKQKAKLLKRRISQLSIDQKLYVGYDF